MPHSAIIPGGTLHYEIDRFIISIYDMKKILGLGARRIQLKTSLFSNYPFLTCFNGRDLKV
jgi:hypothetical protein